jgi:hypothetical protein
MDVNQISKGVLFLIQEELASDLAVDSVDESQGLKKCDVGNFCLWMISNYEAPVESVNKYTDACQRLLRRFELKKSLEQIFSYLDGKLKLEGLSISDAGYRRVALLFLYLGELELDLRYHNTALKIIDLKGAGWPQQEQFKSIMRDSIKGVISDG